MGLRVNGIYRLPNDRELVVTAEEWVDDARVYYLQSADATGPSGYTVNQNGTMSANGRLTAWDVRDLRDTGQSVSIETT